MIHNFLKNLPSNWKGIIFLVWSLIVIIGFIAQFSGYVDIMFTGLKTVFVGS